MTKEEFEALGITKYDLCEFKYFNFGPQKIAGSIDSHAFNDYRYFSSSTGEGPFFKTLCKVFFAPVGCHPDPMPIFKGSLDQFESVRIIEKDFYK